MELARRFHRLYLGLERAHGWFKVGERDAKGKAKGKAKTVQAPVTDELWAQHLSGEIGIGIVPIDDSDRCNWGAIDIDVYDLDHVELEKQITTMEVPLVICRTKSGGAHCYLFLREPASARLLQQRLKECAMALGQPRAEIFPKQIHLTDEAGIGNWINMPYQHAEQTTRYAIHNGRALTADQFLDVAEAACITPDELLELHPKAVSGEDWTQAPPCLEFLAADGFPEGSRNNALLCLGVYAKKRFPEGDWQEKVAEYNNRFMSGSYQEVNNVVKSLSKKSYQYKCGDQPLANHCNKVECRTRQYGITDGKVSRAQAKEDLPCVLDQADKPIKVYRPPEGSSDEPQWTITIAGRHMEVSLDMLMDQKKFLREYTKKFERLALEVTYPRWVESVNQLTAEAEVHDLPPDAGREGQLILHLEAFCTGKSMANDKSELLLGRPWTCEHGLTWFRSKDFVKFCDQQHFREFKEKEMWGIFRRHGAKNTRYMLKGKCVAAWGFPAFAEQTEDFEPVMLPEGEEF